MQREISVSDGGQNQSHAAGTTPAVPTAAATTAAAFATAAAATAAEQTTKDGSQILH